MAADTDTIVGQLERKREASKRIRQRFEPQWYLNLSFYDGKQWVGFDGTQLFEVELDADRVKLTDNRIGPIVRTEIAKMTKTRPVFVGVPRSADDKDLAAARLSERLLEYQWAHQDLTRKMRSALLWSRVCGAGFWKITWDSEVGDGIDVLVGADGKAIKDRYGAPMRPDRLADLPPDYVEQHGLTSRRVAMGDLRIDVRSPFELYVDTLASDAGLDTADWVIEEAVYSERYVYERFPEAQRLDVKADSDSIAGVTESRMGGMFSSALSGSTGPDPQGICLREYWCVPTPSDPGGRHVVWTKSGQLLLDEPNPYPWLPYVMFRGIPVPGRFHPTCTTEQLISPQTELNKVESQIAENSERIGNPPLMRSSHNEDFEWHGMAGEELVFQDMGTPGSIPAFLNVPELPSYVQNRIAQIENSIREISGQHEVTSGTVPSGVTAASAINLLQEADDTRLGPDISDLEQALAGAGQRAVYLMARYFTDQRVVRVAGADGGWEFYAYRKGMLPDDQGVDVKAGSGLPQSKAAKQAAIQEVLAMLVQSGVRLSERDMRQVLQEYEIGGLEKFFSTIGDDERQIARENQRLSNGQQVPVNDFDDDDMHVAGHNAFRKSAAYDELPGNLKAVVDEHVNFHLARVKQNAAMAAATQIPGPPTPMGPNGSLPSPNQPLTLG